MSPFYPKHRHDLGFDRPSDVILNLFNDERFKFNSLYNKKKSRAVYLHYSMLPLKAVSVTTNTAASKLTRTKLTQIQQKRNIRMGGLFDMLTGKGGEGTPKVNASSIYELPNGTDVDGNEFDYSSLKGKVVLITNVASR